MGQDCGATRPFERGYTAAAIRLFGEVDETLGGLCGPTTRRVMRRQYEVFGDERLRALGGAVEQPSLPDAPVYDVRAPSQSHDEAPGRRGANMAPVPLANKNLRMARALCTRELEYEAKAV